MHTILAAGIILAHSWYPIECCSEKDCHPVFDAVEVEGGWQSGGRFYPDAIVKPSKDGQFHSCEGVFTKRPLCFFVPMLT